MNLLKVLNLPSAYFNYLFKKSPLLAGYKITYKCNMRCKHCPFWKNSDTPLIFEKVKEVIDHLSNSGAKIIIFEGGEPTLWSQDGYNFTDVIKYAKGKFFSVNFTTNGLNGFDYPADSIWVSIDGIGDTHDMIRGQGNFQRVISNIKEFAVKKRVIKGLPNIYANICINSLNYLEIPALVCYLKNIVNGITIQFYYPYNENFDLFLEKDKRISLLNRLIELKREKLPLLDSVEALEALKNNSWKCHPEGLINAEPNGVINHGCYLKNRDQINCKLCGFAAHVELSMALDLRISSIISGLNIFFKNS